ncbi:head GIN domain-containing protein [Cellvibrio sp. NN19]|uniref:head GIN domain-containing protein n=1 Tax=Cellvibrio chitinivorans TaxID=3102792 RepID=UPI002B40B626|nr:head GIN domain-containing protein [Cellvibrio sp. NN19]
MVFKSLISVFMFSVLASAAWAGSIAKTYPVKDFSEFSAGGGAKIEITQDGSEYLRIEADAEVMERVKVDQTGKRVSVWIKSDNNFFNWFGQGDDHVKIVLRVKQLEYLELSGGAYAKVNDLKSENFALNNSGAAEVDFADVDANQLRVDLSGAAKMSSERVHSQFQKYELSGASDAKVKAGNVQSLQVNVSGASNMRAKKLTAKNAKLDASGASQIEVTVTDELEAQASGASNINYYGRPKAKTDASGASQVKARDD